MKKQRPTKKSERVQHILNWEQSGQSKKHYSQSVGIKYATFISWFKQEDTGPAGRFHKIEARTNPEEIEIVLPNGIRVYTRAVLTSTLLKTLQDV